MQDLCNRFENAHKFTRLVIDWQHVTTLPTLYVPVIAGVRWVSRRVVKHYNLRVRQFIPTIVKIPILIIFAPDGSKNAIGQQKL